jgi:hypothetical protein
MTLSKTVCMVKNRLKADFSGSCAKRNKPLAACCTCGFFALDAAKNPRLSGCLRSLYGKKSAESRFFGVLCAKRNKLPDNYSIFLPFETFFAIFETGICHFRPKI